MVNPVDVSVFAQITSGEPRNRHDRSVLLSQDSARLQCNHGVVDPDIFLGNQAGVALYVLRADLILLANPLRCY